MSRGFGLGVIALMLLGGIAPDSALATISIHPARIELTLDRGRPSRTITVTNLTDAETRYRAHVRHFTYSKTGAIIQIPPDEHSLAKWTKMNPREFTLPPRGSRVIRLSVIPPKKLTDGEYWAAIEFEPLQGRMVESEDAAGRTMRLEVTASIVVPIIGHVGDLEYGFDLIDLKAWKKDDGVVVSAHVGNTGTGRLRVEGFYEVLNPAGEVIAEGLIGDDVVLFGGERIFTRVAQGDFPGAGYTVRVRYTADKTDELAAGQTQVALEAPEEPEPVLSFD